MHIQKKKKGILVKYKGNPVTLTFDGEYFVIGAPTDSEDVTIEIPGEYEYGEVSYVALEIHPEDKKKVGKPNIVNLLSKSNISTLVIGTAEPLSKEIVEKIPNSNVLVAPVLKLEAIKALVKATQPDKVVFVKMGMVEEEDKVVQKIASEYSKVFADNDAKVTLKDSEFNTGEELIQEFYIV